MTESLGIKNKNEIIIHIYYILKIDSSIVIILLDSLCGKENCVVKTTPARTPRKRVHAPDDVPSPSK